MFRCTSGPALWLAALASTALAPLVARAGERDNAVDAITVTARRLPLSQSDRQFTHLQVPDDRIDLGPGLRLDDALRGLGGIIQFRRATSLVANPTAQGITLRGLGGNAASRALVLLDGIPQDDPFGGWIPWPLLGLEPASITIQRGGASLSGPGALTGAVVLASRAPETGVTAAVSGGRFDSFGAAASVAIHGERSSIAAHGLVERSDGFLLTPGDQRGAADQPAGSRLAAGSLRGALLLSETAELQARVAAFRDRRESGLVVGESRTRGADVSLRAVSRASDDAWRWEVSGYFKHRRFANGFAAADATRATAALTLDQYGVPADGWGLTAEVRSPETGLFAVRAGADARWTDGETRELFRNLGQGFTRDRRAGGESRTLGGFVDVLVRPAPAVTLTAAVRVDEWSLNGGYRREVDRATGLPTLDLAFADRTDTRASGRLGATVKLTPALQLRAAGYATSRAPTLNELFRPFRVGLDVTEANAALPMERLRGIEAGLRFEPANGVIIDAAVYANRLNDAVGNVTLGTGPGVFPLVGFLGAGGIYRQRLPLDRISASGFELWAQAPLGGGFQADASYSHARTRITRAATAPTLVGLRPAQSPRHLLNARVAWQGLDPDNRVAVGLQHVGKQYEDDLNSRVLPSAWTVTASASAALGRGLRLSAHADNLLGAKVLSGLSSTGIESLAAPMSLHVTLSARWPVRR